MKMKQSAKARDVSSQWRVRREGSETAPEAAALAEIGRDVRDDCRVDSKAYLDEVRVAASGE